ncbi:MAG: pilus assembly protein [Acidobacteriia bacterium]|nr:pilus assembly protein [Terriglobia bacterium]
MTSKIPVTRAARLGRGGERGNALVEFALISVVMLMLTGGVADFARLFMIANMAAGAAEAGLQYGALSPSNWNPSGMQTAALNDTGNYTGATATATEFWTCDIGGTQFTTQPTCTGGTTPQTYIQMVVTIPYTSIFKYPFVPDPISVSQLACMRVQ